MADATALFFACNQLKRAVCSSKRCTYRKQLQLNVCTAWGRGATRTARQHSPARTLFKFRCTGQIPSLLCAQGYFLAEPASTQRRSPPARFKRSSTARAHRSAHFEQLGCTCRMAASKAGSAGWPQKRTMPWLSTTSAQGMPVTPAAVISCWPTAPSLSAATCVASAPAVMPAAATSYTGKSQKC